MFKKFNAEIQNINFDSLVVNNKMFHFTLRQECKSVMALSDSSGIYIGRQLLQFLRKSDDGSGAEWFKAMEKRLK